MMAWVLAAWSVTIFSYFFAYFLMGLPSLSLLISYVAYVCLVKTLTYDIM